MTSLNTLTTLHCELSGPVATIILDRPEVLHALNAQMFDELEYVFTTLAADPTVRVLQITGSGERAFAAGADIRALTETDASRSSLSSNLILNATASRS
jgi:enoyl-CoA hydratase